MIEASFTRLRRSKQLQRFLWAEARRLFPKDEALQKDAVSKAWKRIRLRPDTQDFEEYRRHGAQAIAAAEGRKPPSALARLARKAIAGNWEGE